MKKWLFKVLVLWSVTAGSVVWAYAYNVNILSPIQTLKQIFLTPKWQLNSASATIKLDGANGEIDAQKILLSGEQVATQKFAIAVWNQALVKAIEIWNSTNENYYKKLQAELSTKISKQSAGTPVNNSLVKVCNVANVGHYNVYWQLCVKSNGKVTNAPQCKEKNRDWVRFKAWFWSAEWSDGYVGWGHIIGIHSVDDVCKDGWIKPDNIRGSSENVWYAPAYFFK